MSDDIISFETARLAKQRGFKCEHLCKCPTIGQVYNSEGKLKTHAVVYDPDSEYVYASTQSLLQKWLRETYDVDIEISLAIDDELKVILPKVYEIYFPLCGPVDHSYKKFFETYEDALEAALRGALQII